MRDDWFAPKRYGYGAGLPRTWQGWVLLGGYVALVVLLAVTVARRHPALYLALVLAISVPLLIVGARHTRGGWRWRWGRDP